MSVILTKAQKLCGKRGHGFVALLDTGECISGCVYCGAYSARTVGVATITANVAEMVTRAALVFAIVAFGVTLLTLAAWLGAAL